MIRFFLGFLIVAGVAGSDCDGKCMPGMPLDQMLIYSLVGLALMAWGLPKMVDKYGR